eukprot:gene47803-35675_t
MPTLRGDPTFRDAALGCLNGVTGVLIVYDAAAGGGAVDGARRWADAVAAAAPAGAAVAVVGAKAPELDSHLH